jgi:hypothetical protein
MHAAFPRIMRICWDASNKTNDSSQSETVHQKQIVKVMTRNQGRWMSCPLSTGVQGMWSSGRKATAGFLRRRPSKQNKTRETTLYNHIHTGQVLQMKRLGTLFEYTALLHIFTTILFVV